jgi:hypothetical protein
VTTNSKLDSLRALRQEKIDALNKKFRAEFDKLSQELRAGTIDPGDEFRARADEVHRNRYQELDQMDDWFLGELDKLGAPEAEEFRQMLDKVRRSRRR